MKKTIYITIDDAPSKHTSTKVDYLKQNNIPALFFCRGEQITYHIKHLIYAIRQGFVLGNHSYSHPYFSKLSFKEQKEEILSTEKLLDECYARAGVKRPVKIIRLPFCDRGKNPEQIEALQTFLKEQNFISYHESIIQDGFIDMPWTWDTYDYKKALINNTREYKKRLNQHWKKSALDKEIMLLHDFGYNHHLFEATMDWLAHKDVTFGSLAQDVTV